MAYKVDFPALAMVHPIFHVLQLKKKKKKKLWCHQSKFPLFLSEELELQVKPRQVTKVWTMKDGEIEVLIK